MPDRRPFAMVSSRAPTIVVATLCAALVGYRAEVPVWIPYCLTVVVGALALVVMASRERRVERSADDDPDADKGWLAQELAGRGSASGSYLLGFFALVTLVLTGFQGPYTLPAWAALALAAAWGAANARQPAREETEH